MRLDLLATKHAELQFYRALARLIGCPPKSLLSLRSGAATPPFNTVLFTAKTLAAGLGPAFALAVKAFGFAMTLFWQKTNMETQEAEEHEIGMALVDGEKSAQGKPREKIHGTKISLLTNKLTKPFFQITSENQVLQTKLKSIPC